MKVSICIPAYKHPDFLQRCIDSVLIQEFQDYEIIITDDSPDDALEKFIKTYDDSRIHYHRNQKPLGSPLNWNEAIKKAKGEYIKIIHHDDWLSSPQSLGKYVALLDENPDTDISFSGFWNIYPDGNNEKRVAPTAFLDRLKKYPETVFLANRLGPPSACVFRNNKQYFFDSELIWVVDIEFYIRVISVKRKYIYSPEPLVNIGISQHQITYSILIESKTRVKEVTGIFEKLNLIEKDAIYKRTLLRILGRNRIFNDRELKKILPKTGFHFSTIDILTARYYYLKMKTRNLFKS